MTLGHLLARMVRRRPLAVLVVLAVLTGGAAWRASHLRINQDQLDLLPDDLASVQQTRRVRELLGGEGHLVVALRSRDPELMKRVADDLAARLAEAPEIRGVTHKLPIELVRERLPMFIEPADLEWALTEFRRFLEHDGRSTPSPPLLHPAKVIQRLLARYRAVSGKRIDDDYFIDRSGTMLLLFVKPDGSSTDLPFLRRLIDRVRQTVDDYGRDNPRRARLAESYRGYPPGVTVAYGLTGTYKRNLDNSENLTRALAPTMALASAGILLFVLLLLRRPLLVGVVMLPLLAATVLTYGFCAIAIGELNTVTAMLGSIQVGMGIDSAIHLVSRLREELGRSQHIDEAVDATLRGTVRPAAVSALTSAAALFLLALGEFKGFSHFGLAMGAGVLLTFAVLYLAVPAQLLLLLRRWPALERRLAKQVADEGGGAAPARRFPAARAIAIAGALCTLGLGAAATGIRFDYDGRSVMAANRPATRLQEEIDRRFDASADPVVLYAATLDEARALHAHLMARPADSRIASVSSLFSLVPPAAQQQRNRALLDGFQAYLSAHPPATSYQQGKRDLFDRMTPLLEARPFTLEDVPAELVERFRPLPESGATGYLTYLYPAAVPWDSRELDRFATEAGVIRVGDVDYRSGGMLVVFADLSRSVIRGGRDLCLYSAAAIFVVILLVFRRLRAAALITLPLVVGIAWMLGLMALLGWRMNYFNIVVLPVIFATGIDSGVYIYGRFLESGSVWTAVRYTGVANASTAITTGIGWAALLASGHRGLVSMGVLATVGIACAFIISVTLLPALLELTRRDQQPSVPGGATSQNPASGPSAVRTSSE